MVGTTISHYKIIDKIGQGGMGELYRATDTKLNRDVALKVLPEAFASDQQAWPGSRVKPRCWLHLIIPTLPPFAQQTGG